MTRSVMIVALCGLMLAGLMLTGCTDQRRPTKQTTKIDESAAPATPPHGMPPQGMPQGMPPASSSGPEVRLADLVLTAPEGWARKQPRTPFTLAEFSLPAAEGDSQAARLTITVAGGGVEMNVNRWRGQFGGSEEQQPQEIEIAGRKVTFVDFSGTDQGQHGTMAPQGKQEGQRMLGAIIPLGRQLGFIKCTGPEKTVAAHAEEFNAYVRSMKPFEQKSATEEPVQEEPVTEEPVTEEPVTEEPVTEEPVTEEPVTEEPVTEEPAQEEPVVEE